MLMTAEEYVAENSHVPACYNALGDVCVIFEHTESGYDIKFYCEIPNVLEAKSVVHCSTSEMFLSEFNEMKPVIDKWFVQLKKIYDSNISLVNSLTNEIDVDSLDKYIDTPLRLSIGYTTISLGGYNGELIGFISDFRTDTFKTVILTEDNVREIMELNKEQNDYIKSINDEIEELCE
jgi:hypothetical protein